MTEKESLTDAVGTSFDLFDALAEAVFLLDDEGRITSANAAAETLIGRTRRALSGVDVAEFLPEAAGWFRRRAAAPGAVEAASFMLPAVEFLRGLLPSVRVRASFSSLSPKPSNAPSGTTALLEVVDLDDALRAERDAIAEAGRAANSELLRNLAHEIKNPLGGIRGAAQLLESELVRDEDRECTNVILEEAARLQELAQGLTIERDYDISAPAVFGDRGRFTQVFLNLARNAAEAMTEGRAHGTAVIIFKTRIARDVMLAGTRTRTALRIDVVDNGPGVPEHLKERIFFPLVTGRAEGSGLGLALVKTFVEEAGGSITLESRPGRTDFTVLLPLEGREARENREAKNGKGA